MQRRSGVTVSLTLFLNYIFQMAINVGRESREKENISFPFFSSLPNAFAGTIRSSISHYLFALAFGIWKCVVSCVYAYEPRLAFVHIVNCSQTLFFPFFGSTFRCLCDVWQESRSAQTRSTVESEKWPCVACCLSVAFPCAPYRP